MCWPGIPYDCDSIMNFGTETFSLGKPTMESVDPNCNLKLVSCSIISFESHSK